MVVVLGGALLITKWRADRAAESSISTALDATQAAVEAELAGRSQALLDVTAALARVPTYVSRVDEALRTDNRANLLDQADEFSDQVSAAWTLITDAQGIVKASTYDRDLFDEDFSEGSLIGIALEGELTQGTWIEPGEEGDELYQAVGVPILDPARTTVFGVLVAAVPLDSAFVSALKVRTTSDVTVFALDTLGVPVPTSSTVPRGDIADALLGFNADSAFADTAGAPRVRLTAGGERLVGVVGPLLTASGFPIGGYVGYRSWDRELAVYAQLQQTIVIAFVVGLILALVSSLIVARQITRPVRRLVEVTRRATEGEYTGRIDIHSRDEIGELSGAFERMLQELREKEELVAYLSAASMGTTERVPKSDDATLVMEQPRSVATSIKVGTLLAGRYEIKEVIGAGGMGVVYRARDRELDEQIAIKTLKPEAMEADTSVLERFKQEIRLARRITHRNVVRTHDLGESNGSYFITMEYVEGRTLKDIVRRVGKLPVKAVITVGRQLCRALEVAHEQGVIHRDIKPQNLVVDRGGFVKVMDFGIARLAGARPAAGKQLTATGSAIGTPDYMAPEQLLGQEVDARCDIYAAGAVLYECVSGRVVFDAPSLPALIACHLETSPEDPRTLNPEVSDELARVILRALAKKPADRWQSAKELKVALETARVHMTTAA